MQLLVTVWRLNIVFFSMCLRYFNDHLNFKSQLVMKLSNIEIKLTVIENIIAYVQNHCVKILFYVHI